MAQGVSGGVYPAQESHKQGQKVLTWSVSALVLFVTMKLLRLDKKAIVAFNASAGKNPACIIVLDHFFRPSVRGLWCCHCQPSPKV